MTFTLTWEDRLPALTAGAEGPRRFATYNSLAEALAQAHNDDGLEVYEIRDDESGEVAAGKKAIADYSKAREEHAAALAEAIEKAHAAHDAAVAKLA